ncbi:hypothetical protein BZA05DRAFT_342491 [Tricharina praecox]|uniref:uncharacterized protein n=1 Tax=Tricharina praecox TaxID=43433 RepID=UPI00221FCCE2|nr:uncharacterized protein BZA05DRAFT_342491 [Tricharina praecox]KAI5845364.1 hypothetical protein BZA05DRAFT_342491 [Tricharina praecox]
MSSSTYDSSRQSSVPDSVPSLDHHSAGTSFDTPQESELFDSASGASLNTYCTTVASINEDDDDIYNCYEDYTDEPSRSKAVPATPQEFAEHFPSTRRLIIKHDDSTLDGNMNVRVDCDAPTRREHDRRITLFHLRMYDLRDRDFSVRRYGRDCGREVAHVKRKVAKTVLQRPVLRKALSSFRSKSSADELRKVERVDSGYGSNPDDEEEPDVSPTTPGGTKPTNTCTLEFSNYAHVDLTRRGAKSGKKYDFEYWGKSYSWRRRIAAGMSEEVSYELHNNATNNVVAYIRPDILTPAMVAIEEAKGGFVPPCSLYFNDSNTDPINSNTADVADVIITTGLVALVDDCIKRKYHKKKSVRLVLPTTGKTPLKMNMEYVGPKRFIDEMFHRRPIISRSQSVQFGRTAPPTSPTPPRRMFTS